MKKIIVWILMAASMVGTADAATIGDDGLHKAPWIKDTFKDLNEDLAEANVEGKRLMLIVEQQGCIYCRKMHEEVFIIPEIENILQDRFYVVQINMFGDVEVTDFDGEVLSEKKMVKKWGALFTPSIYFFPEEVLPGTSASQAAVASMPGAFGRWTTQNMLTWVLEKGYSSDEPFQKYHARKFTEQQ
jgi:thioredoxin-related protein